MSGIAGTYSLDGRAVRSEDIREMVDVMAHRGPDGATVWCEESVGVGHRMLHTTPEALHERQPLHSRSSSVVLVADVRIDNREALLRKLDMRHTEADPVTDADLVLTSYEKWGEDCVAHLLGAFAFAVWDARARKLFCARDHFGVKPFCYYHEPGRRFAFGSEIKAILCLPDVPRDLNERRIGDLLAVINEDQVGTIYDAIKRLPPAHVLSVSPEAGLRVRRYWTLRPVASGATTDAEYAERFRELFTEAVRCRLRSASPVASDLSGGLDSSSVVGVAAQALGEQGRAPLHVICQRYDNFEISDETPYMEAVIAEGEIEPHVLQGDALTTLSILDDVFCYVDDPAYSLGNHHLVWQRFAEAQRIGARVVLNGFDGDTVVGHGYEQLAALIKDGRWGDFAREVRIAAERVRSSKHRQATEGLTTIGGWLDRFTLPYLNRLAIGGRYTEFARAVRQIKKHFGVPARVLYRRYWRRLLTPQAIVRARHRAQQQAGELPPAINRAFAQQIGLRKRIEEVNRFDAAELSAEERQRQLLVSERFTRPLEGLNHYAAACSVEARHPFMDKRLVEFCLALPVEQKYRDGWNRYALRQAMHGIVPDVVRWRPGKATLGPATSHGLLNTDAPIVERYAHDLGAISRYVDAGRFRAMYSERTSMNHIGVHRLVLITALAHWSRNSYVSSV